MLENMRIYIGQNLRFVLLVAAMLVFPAVVFATPLCQDVLIRMDPGLSVTFEELAGLKLQLEEAKVSSDNSLTVTALRAEYPKKEAKLLQYLLENRIMTAEQMQSKMRFVIKRLQEQMAEKQKREKENKEKQAIEVKDVLDIMRDHQRMRFHEIAPGDAVVVTHNKGKRGLAIKSVRQAFAMMDTPVTQLMWARLKILMGEKSLNKINPSTFDSGDNMTIITIDGIDVKLQPDNPIESVTSKDVYEFTKALNILSASDKEDVQEMLAQVIPGHQKDDIYDIANDKQWLLVMSNRGYADKRFFDREDDSELHKYAWYSANSGGQTHPVAQLQPRMIDIDGKGTLVPFYDLEGNVANMVLMNSTDISSKGFGSQTDPNSELPDKLSFHGPNPQLGFRLVRIRR